MTSKLTRERLQEIAEDGFLKHGESKELARIALAAMDSESGCLPLDYLQGHKDGLEWAAQLAEANHPETGDWLYYDPIELAKAIRKGPDMPPAQSVADSEPVIVVGDDGGDALSYRRLIQSFEPGTKLYRHPQPAPVVPDDYQHLRELYHTLEKRLFKISQRIKGASFDKYSHSPSQAIDVLEVAIFGEDEACCAAILSAAPHDTPTLNSVQSVVTVPGKWIPVSERMPEKNGTYQVWNGEHVGAVPFLFGSFQCLNPDQVTHWMPTAKPPREVKCE
ncbi:DUF551 domain-containing protein [Klebsiella pneumoniae]|uniref:DUF551 domain-containing protein n=1 Tax=Klebsiella pneumoniae TaxID=573 RepID=UPI0037BF3BC1